jgi:hypothetical protein
MSETRILPRFSSSFSFEFSVPLTVQIVKFRNDFFNPKSAIGCGRRPRRVLRGVLLSFRRVPENFTHTKECCGVHIP